MTIQCSIRRRVGGLGPIVLAFVLATTGCAARVAPSATDIRPVLKATRVAIATAHARLDSAIARSDTAAVMGLFDDSVTVYTREARVAARGRNGALAALATLRVANVPGAVVAVPRVWDSCLDSGYEIGTFTVYNSDPDGGRIGTSGPYAIAWRIRDGHAVIQTLVVGRGGDFERPPSAVNCTTGGALLQRSSRFTIAATGAYTSWPAFQSLKTSSLNAGWTQPSSAGASGAPACGSRSQWSIADAAQSSISVRMRLTQRFGAEVVAGPSTLTGCTRALSVARSTTMWQSLNVSGNLALLNYLAGGFRLGLGVSSAHVRLQAYEDSAVAVYHSARVTTTASTLGVAGQLAYSHPITRFISAEAAGRFWEGPTVESARLLYFTPHPINTSGHSLSVGLGLAF